MRKLFVLLSLVAFSAFAEPSFQQVETLIEQKNFQSAEMALEQIISAHPNSAKAFYAMAQAQAGLGNLGKAQYALNKARAIDPELKFASSSNIESLTQAITPQSQKIEVVTESHFWRNLFLILFVGAMGFIIYNFFIRKNDEADDDYRKRTNNTPNPTPPSPATPQAKVDAVNAQPLKTAQPEAKASIATSGPAVQQPMYTPAPQASSPTVVNNHYGSSNDGFVTGMLVGNMLSGGHDHHHDTYHDTTVIRETVREVPAPAPTRDTSWDDTPTPAASKSSWDDTPAPSRSSSWDDDSSSSRSSSSWSSSSSDSSSSWSSSSSDSGSSWGSSDSSSSSSDW